MITDLTEMAQTMARAVDYMLEQNPNEAHTVNMMAWATFDRPERFEVIGQTVEQFQRAEGQGEGAYIILDDAFLEEGVRQGICETTEESARRALKVVGAVEGFAFVATLLNPYTGEKICRIYCCTNDGRVATITGTPVYAPGDFYIGKRAIASIAWQPVEESKITVRTPFLASFWQTYESEVASRN